MKQRLILCLVFLFSYFPFSLYSAPLTLCDLCSNFTISKRADGAVVIRCPGNPNPIFVLNNCKNPKVTKTKDKVSIVCDMKG